MATERTIRHVRERSTLKMNVVNINSNREISYLYSEQVAIALLEWDNSSRCYARYTISNWREINGSCRISPALFAIAKSVFIHSSIRYWITQWRTIKFRLFTQHAKYIVRTRRNEKRPEHEKKLNAAFANNSLLTQEVIARITPRILDLWFWALVRQFSCVINFKMWMKFQGKLNGWKEKDI